MAQVFSGSPSPANGGQTLPENREVVLQLRRAEAEIGEGRSAEAIDRLQLILDHAEDFFVDVAGSLTAREQAQQLLLTMPAEGRRLYEQKFGQQAAALWESADRRNDPHEQMDVMRRYFLTEAGGLAAWRHAVNEMDRGHMLVAARWFEQLQKHDLAQRWEPELSQHHVLSLWRAGDPQRSSQALLNLVAATTEPILEGAQVPKLTTLDEVRTWLDTHLGEPVRAVDRPVRDWRVAGGNLEHAASFRTGTPVWDAEWERPVIDASEVPATDQYEEVLTELDSLQLRNAAQTRQSQLPVHAPIVVGDTLIFGSYGHVNGVDVSSGRLRWRTYEPDDTFSFLVNSSMYTNAVSPGGPRIPGPLSTFLEQRAWRDQTSASLSSDGRYVFVIKDSGLPGALSQNVLSTQIGEHPLRADSHNLLRAYEVDGGRLKWEAGGPRPGQSAARRDILSRSPAACTGRTVCTG